MSAAPEPIGSPGPWWRDAVIYQIYVRSFADADGDGIGDLRGIRSRLGELRDLGVDAIWLTPFYRSPQIDGGYDVADHRDVDPRFGTLDDIDDLVRAAHEHRLRVIIDLVPNHTSDQHPWFQAALAAAPGSPERTRYLFRDGRGPTGDEPPNDWASVFGGPAWTRVRGADGSPGQWYLHLFAPEQPDLDWTNGEVRREFESIIEFWSARDVDGFRVDVAHGLAKDADMADLAGRFAAGGLAHTGHPHWDQDAIHDVYRSWRRLLDSLPGDRMFVAEAYVQSPERLARYVRPDELHTTFNFNLLHAPWDAAEWRATIEASVTTLAEVGAEPTWVLSTHDVVRHPTRYGGGDIGRHRARAATLLILALPGVAYLYQGEELGLEEVLDLPDDMLADPTFERSGGTDRGRDGCRVPLPWSGDEAPFGFGPGPETWLPQPREWAGLTVERQMADAASTRSWYRAALRIRPRATGRQSPMPLTWIETTGDVVAFRRGASFVSVTNFGDAAASVPESLHELDDATFQSRRHGSAHEISGATTKWFHLDRKDPGAEASPAG